MKKAQKMNYTEFYNENKDIIGDRPISMQVGDAPLEQGRKIAAIGENVWAKVPIVNNLETIAFLRELGHKVNVTAVFTKEQIKTLRPILDQNETQVVVSIFAGRISDTGVDPFSTVQYAVHLFSDMPWVEILWAGCKEVLSIRHAIRAGAQIITIPDSIIEKLDRLDKNLEEFSIETARDFTADGNNLSI
jgi:transaldolase